MRGILRDSGWNGIELRSLDIACAMPERAGRLLPTINPVGVVLQNADKRTRAQMHGDEVRFSAACWMVSVRVEKLATPSRSPRWRGRRLRRHYLGTSRWARMASAPVATRTVLGRRDHVPDLLDLGARQ